MVTLWKEREPVYVRRRKMILEDNGGVVPPFDTGVIGDDVGDAGAGEPRRDRRARTPVAAGPAAATAAGPEPTTVAPAASPPSEPRANGAADGDGAKTSAEAAAAARREKRAQNRARKKHGRKR